MLLRTVFLKALRDRWAGEVIAATGLGAFLLAAMAVYRDIDLSLYSDLPEAVRALMNIPAGADVASLSYGVMYGSIAALTLASLALSMGSSAATGEERSGTIGLLLANPKSRVHLLLSKTAAMVALTGLGALVLWGLGRLAPELLGVDVGGTAVGAIALHLFVNALFYGFLALAIGGWTGNGALASGASAAVMVGSYVAVGVLPVLGGVWGDGARVFPWYYFDGGQPLVHGVAWAHVAVLLGAAACFAAVAVIGINRRDLRGRTGGASLLDRLRTNPLTRRIVERLAGSTRVSRIWVKTASDHQGLLLVTTASAFFLCILEGPVYSFIDEDIRSLTESLPEALVALIGGADMSTPEGWLTGELFSFVAPVAVILVTVVVGAGAVAGEEARRTLGLLLANPISRKRVVIEKGLALTVVGVVVGIAVFGGTMIGVLAGGLDVRAANVAAASLLVTLLGLVFGALALAVGAGTGMAKLAAYGAAGAALALYLLDSFLPLSDRLAGLARLSPFHYYLGGDPLTNGLDGAHAGVLAALALVLLALAVALVERRDLRQSG